MKLQLLTDLLAYMPSKLLPALTAFITIPIFTRLFSPDDYGNYILAFGIAELLLAAFYSGYGASIIRFYTTYRVNARLSEYFASLFTSVGILVLIGSGLTALILLVFRSAILPNLYPLLWLALAVFAGNALFSTLLQVLRAEERSRWYTAIELLNRYGTILAGLALILLFHAGVAGLLLGEFLVLTALATVVFILLTRGTPLHRNNISRNTIKIMGSYAFPITLGNLAIWGLRLADRYIISLFRGSYEVGLYSVSYNISSRSIDLLVGLFLLVPGPIIFRLWEEQGREAAEESLRDATRLFMLLIIPAVIGLALVAAPLVRLLAEESYFEGYQAVGLVAFSSVAWGLGQVASFGMLVAHQTVQLAVNQFIAMLIGFGLNLMLVPLWGFMGAACTCCFTFLILLGLNARSSSRYLTWHWTWKTLLHVVVACGLMSLAVTPVIIWWGNHANSSPLIATGLAALIGVVVYSVALVGLGEMSLSGIYNLMFRSGSHQPASAGKRRIT